MAVRIKVDEDLPVEVANRLRGNGHDAHTVVDQGLSGTSDERLWNHVQQERYCLITADKGFADARTAPPGTHNGIVLMRLPRESRAGYVQLTERLLESVDFEALPDSVAVVTPGAVRIHHGR